MYIRGTYNGGCSQLKASKRYKRPLMHIQKKYNEDLGHLNAYQGQKRALMHEKENSLKNATNQRQMRGTKEL